ncbi:MAG: amidoligase family protein [Candidatus Pacebacteria bacterium]|nr:amidoligase family protein [Candidatus Paceibacterota bacterium]
MPLDEFKNKFKFDESRHLCFGVERELYITRDGEFFPLADEILKSIDHDMFPSTWTHEFSACALEQTIGPAQIEKLHETILAMDESKDMIEKQFDVKLQAFEVAPENLPDDVYPDPSGRYQAIQDTSPEELVDAARRTCGIHVHIGIGNHSDALQVHQTLCNESFMEYLLSIGDNSNRERIELMKHFTEWTFDSFSSWQDFYDHLEKKNLLHDIKSYRPLIRLTRHGTIEFRMFGSTNSKELIEFYIKTCYNLVKFALKNIELKNSI